MTINARKITFLMSIFFTLFFGFNCFAFVEGYQLNEFLRYSDGQVQTSGVVLNYLNYDENNKVAIELEIISDNSLIYSKELYDSIVLLPRWTSEYDSIVFHNTGVILKSFTCASNEWTGHYGFKYCKYNGNGIMQYDNIVYYGGLYNSLYNATGITKTDIDTYCGNNFLENTTFEYLGLCFPYSDDTGEYCAIFFLNTETYDPPTTTGTEESFPYQAEPPAPVNGLCGLDNGETTNQEPPVPPRTLCQAGNETEVIFNGNNWTWTCEGTNGGSNDDCISYNTEPVNALCGLYDGNYYDEPPTTPEDFCELGNLIFPSFVKTSLGWTWTCAGFNGGNNSFCTAYENMGNLPELPDQDDCSLQDIPDRWFCEISNSLKSIFLPDTEKLNELQETINKINGKFPFNYLSIASSRLETLKENTNNDTITISLLDNEGEVNLQAIEPLSEKLKIYTAGLFIIGFIFWAIGYIKNFFK